MQAGHSKLVVMVAMNAIYEVYMTNGGGSRAEAAALIPPKSLSSTGCLLGLHIWQQEDLDSLTKKARLCSPGPARCIWAGCGTCPAVAGPEHMHEIAHGAFCDINAPQARLLDNSACMAVFDLLTMLAHLHVNGAAAGGLSPCHAAYSLTRQDKPAAVALSVPTQSAVTKT